MADTLPMEHMILQLRRSPADEQTVKDYIDSLHDSASVNFQRWMTPDEFGAAFGAAPADRIAITQWLESHRFKVNSMPPGGMTIDFSGTAGNVREAFHTEIHHLDVGGVRHIANMSDPQIPAALAPAVAGIVSLHDFSPRPMKRERAHAAYTFAGRGGTYQAVSPGDLATIYNLSPLFAAGTTGAGQTIAVIEDTDLYTPADWNTFRSTFGLTKYTSGTLTTIHPAPTSGSNNCLAPGVVAGDDGEAILDAEWASAAAPGAAIQVASCASTRTTFGGLIALQNLVNAKAPPSIVSISYGECEAGNGAAANAVFNSVYQQAAAEGISVFVAAGDEGAASCDAGAKGATHGIGVSGFASTPYNVAVGGTDFGDSAAGTNGSYWSTTNSSAFASALSYIPEIPWNDSCASSLIASHFGYNTVYGTSGFCGSSTAQADGLLSVVAGSGGPSGCATGNPSATNTVGGTCRGNAKPSWQAGVAGIPSDGVRDIPDVSLFAGAGLWGHYYIVCWSDVRNGGAPCNGAPSTWGGAGGTSFGAPILAGIQALVNQTYAGAQGNPNYVYYKLAANSLNVCDSSGAIASGCIFHNVTTGDNDVNCGGNQDCYGVSATSGVSPSCPPGFVCHFGPGGPGPGGPGFPGQSFNGALSVTDQSYTPAYKASTGWSFASGLGSVDAYNLVAIWRSGR
ncbi:MAG TPA: S53 family peptidase [Bryobacteraceae bacterium]|nr:S53 family peptidase [Bryobacteraceae bacterium]